MDKIETNKWLTSNMKSYTLIFSKKTILVLVGLCCLILYPIGIYLYQNNYPSNESFFDYTDCSRLAPQQLAVPVKSNGISRWQFDPKTRLCTIEFTIDQDIIDVHLYLRISNMYQNHRLYLKSLSPDQLKGKLYRTATELHDDDATTTCGYLTFANCDTAQKYSFTNYLTYAQNNPDCKTKDPVIVNADKEAQYYPCGLIANSYFTDELSALVEVNTKKRVEFYQDDISWPEDAALYQTTAWKDYASDADINKFLIPPPQWRQAYPLIWGNGYNKTNLPDLKQWKRLHVWMRKASLPTFKKLWGKANTNLLKGTYQITIKDVWNATRFQGTKSLYFSEVGVLGPRNDILGIMFLSTASVCLGIFVFVLVWNPREVGELSKASWNKSD